MMFCDMNDVLGDAGEVITWITWIKFENGLCDEIK